MANKLFHGKIAKGILLLCIVAMITLSSVSGLSAAYAKNLPLREKYKSQMIKREMDYDIELVNDSYYSEVLEEYESKGYKAAEDVSIVLTVDDIVDSSEDSIPIEKGIAGLDKPVLVWDEDCEWFEWAFEAPEEGLYQIDVEYYPVPGSGTNIHREIMINGEVQCYEAHNIVFYRLWNDEGKPKINNIGDEVRPRQKEFPRWVTQSIMDSLGFYDEPLLFYFKKGLNTIRLNMLDQPIAISSIHIKSPDKIPSYEEVRKQYEEKAYKNASTTHKFQAESNIIEKNDSTIRLESDSDPATEPISRGNIKLNIIGAGRWDEPNQSITWEFDVEEDGLYQIAMRLNQSYADGMPSYRQIMIDGKVPFAEMKSYGFVYDNKWRMEVLQDEEGEPYLFYLEKGTHTLTMTVKMGPLYEIYQALYKDIIFLSDIISDIYMITGPNPDPNYRYELDKKIPTLMDDLKYLAESMRIQSEKLESIAGKQTVISSNLKSIRKQLQDMIANPDIITIRLNNLTNAQSSLGTWISALEESPLAIDYFLITPPGAELPNPQSNFFGRLATTFVNFITSFTKDYDNVSGVAEHSDLAEASKTIEVWTTRGREWAELMKELIDADFTPKTGINVKMNVLPSSQLEAGSINVLMLSIISGKAPDVAIGVSSQSPVEFAIREAVLDLTQFEDFPTVKERFLPGIITPYEYLGGVYALPETMNFTVLFYRKDIMSELGLPIPETWDELYNYVLPVLYQNHMEFSPPMVNTGNPMEGYAAFLYQHGGEFYTQDRMKSALDTPEAYRAFKEFTELFTNYGIPVEANFFNRMRTGVMPMGIGDFSLYIRLSVAAPELLGRWGIAPIPGHRREDGTIDRSTMSPGAEAIMIMSQTEMPEESWEFVKWWTSAEVQADFGKEIEALMGPQARWNTANLEAFKQLPWHRDDIKVIEAQWPWIKEPPVVLGGYFTSRHIKNAYTRVVMEGMNVRDSLEQAVKDINIELRVKQEEYGVLPEE